MPPFQHTAAPSATSQRNFIDGAAAALLDYFRSEVRLASNEAPPKNPKSNLFSEDFHVYQ